MQSSWFDSSFVSPYSLCSSSTKTIIIRLASLDDTFQIGDILTHSFNQFNAFTYWAYPLIRLGISQDLRSRLKSDEQNSFCLVAIMLSKIGTDIYQQIVGTAELSIRTRSHWHNYQKYVYISNLAVSKHHRRQGIASKLLLKCEQIARQENFADIFLHVLASNQVGQKLYLNHGYTIKQVETDLFSLFVTSKRRLLLTKSLK